MKRKLPHIKLNMSHIKEVDRKEKKLSVRKRHGSKGTPFSIVSFN